MKRAACILALWPLALCAAPVDDAVAELQQDWEVIRYQAPASEREKRFESLSAKARKVAETYPGRSEPLIWEGVILSAWAREKGGIGALGLAKQAKADYEQALQIDAKAFDGSAYHGLGALYYQVPGWPLGFGDKAKAKELLQQALAINPNGIDPNFFYAEYLVQSGKADEAMSYLKKALLAPTRPGRYIADSGRREEARALLAKIRSA
jgi:tetratricopeptide (TPR) repeat protein